MTQSHSQCMDVGLLTESCYKINIGMLRSATASSVAIKRNPPPVAPGGGLRYRNFSA